MVFTYPPHIITSYPWYAGRTCSTVRGEHFISLSGSSHGVPGNISMQVLLCPFFRGFPKMGVLPNHPFLDGMFKLSLINQAAIGDPHLWKPQYWWRLKCENPDNGGCSSHSNALEDSPHCGRNSSFDLAPLNRVEAWSQEVLFLRNHVTHVFNEKL